MGENNTLLTLAVIAVAVSIVAAGFTYFSIINLSSKISGLASSTGEANLTIEEVAAINFTVNSVEWGSGRVDIGFTSASLTSFETNNVTNGNWTLLTSGGLRLENIGGVNVSVNLSSSVNAATFIGGTSPIFEWNITNSEANSCLDAAGTSPAPLLDVFRTVNTTADALFCPVFQFGSANDEIRIDFNLTIPDDSSTGFRSATITAIGLTV